MHRHYSSPGLIAKVFLLACMIFLAPTISLAKNKELLVVTNNNQPLHQRFIALLKKSLTASSTNNIHLKVISLDTWQTQLTNQYQLTLALGNKVMFKLSQHQFSGDVLFSLIPSTTYRKIMASSNTCQHNNCSAIYIDQPVQRTLTLTKLALPNAKTIGLLRSQHSGLDQIKISALAAKYNLSIKQQDIPDRNNLVFGLKKVLHNSDALLSLPDPNIYTRHTVQNILLTAYQYRKPVIGYSHAFVRAGALFAVYSSLPQLAKQTAEEINDFFSRNKLIQPQFPHYFSVSVNQMVANSLDIKIDSPLSLQKKLEATTNE